MKATSPAKRLNIVLNIDIPVIPDDIVSTPVWYNKRQ